MAEDRLMFQIGFDLDSATKEAEEKWGSKYAAQLEKTIQKRPIKIKLDYDIKQLGNLEAVQKRLKELKIATVTPETKGAISSLVLELKNLESILKRIDRLNAANARQNASANAANELAAQRAARTAEIQARTNARAQQEAAKLAIMQERLNQAKLRTVQAEQRLANAARGTNSAYSAQEGYISRLLKRTAVLFGISQVARFAEHLRKVTAEFELQRVSLGTIIQDQEKANALFSQIKTFAVQSPFEIKDLVGYVKQLSAYRIETDKLFDTTKRLADVSAGLGVGMDRLILAYGQVKAASVLRGTEVRQFTEAGIPLIELLAEKFTALRGEMVSTSEVFDLISQRAVSFEMVAEIFEDMTNAGGMFYNMQEKQAATLYGQWSNLKDSIAIMYDEMGNTSSVRGAMEGFINLTKTLAENWRDVRLVAYEVFGGVVLSKSIGTIKSFIQLIRKDAIGAIRQQIVAQEEYNAAVKAEGNILATATAEEKAAAATRVASAKATRDAAVATAQAARSTNVLTMAWRRFTAVLKANWVGIVLAVLTALINYIAHAVRKSNELKNALADIEREGAKNIATTTRNFERLAKKAVEAADGSKEQKDALSELHRTYRDMIPIQDMTINKLRELKGNYEALTTAVREYINQRTLESKINAITEKFSKDIEDAKKGLDDIFNKGTYQQFRQRDSLLFGKGSSWKKTDIPFELDDAQISEVKRQVQMLAEDTLKSYYEIWVEALSEVIDITPEIRKAISGMLAPASGVSNQMEALIDSTRGMQKSIKDVTDEMASSTKYVGKYRKEWEALQKSVGEVKVDFLDEDGQETFLSRQDKVNKQVNLYAQSIKNVVDATNEELNKAGKPLIKLQDEWFNLVDAIDEANPSRVSNIQIDAIIKGLSGKYPQLKKYLEKIREEYYKVIPDSRTVNVLNETMTKYAKSVDISMDNVKQYLMGSGDTIEEYAKRAQEDLARVTAKLAEMALIDQQISKGIGIGVYKSTDPDEKKKAEDIEKFLKHYIELLDEFTKKSGRTSRTDNTQLNLLKEEASLLQRVYKEYTELIKIQSQAAAAKKIKDIYGGLLSSFGIESAPTTFDELMKDLDSVVKRMQKLPDSQKSVVELKATIGSLNTNEEKAKLEKELKRLADEVSRTKTAKEFFEKILAQTGDVELATDLSFSIYGEDINTLKQRIIKNIQATLGKTNKGLDIDFASAVRTDDTINYDELVRVADEQLKLGNINEETHNKILKMRDEDRKDLAKTIEGWLKATEKAKSYSDKMLDLARTTNDEITRINTQKGYAQNRITELLGMENLTEEGQAELANLQNFLSIADNLIQGFKDKQAKEETTLAYEAFKDSPMYVQLFDNLDSASTTMLNAMRDRLVNLKSEWKNLDPTQLKEMQQRLREIDEQLTSRNPFKTLIKGIKDYRNLRTKGDSMGSKSSREADKKLLDMTEERIKAENEYKTILEDENATQEQIADAKGKFDNAQQNEQGAQKAKEAWQDVGATIGSATDTILGGFGAMGSIASVVADIMEAVGADEEDVAYWRTVGDSMSEITAGIRDIVHSILDGDLMGVITSIITAIPKMFIGIFNVFSAGKIRRANKEIKRQQKILDSLEHSYERLQKAADQLLGSEYVANFRKQQQNLRAQITATEKQLAAERSKGSKKDDEKIKQYEEQIRSLKDELEDLQSKIGEQMLGTDLASAARSFAQAWLEAYKEFGDTRKAIEGEMEKMIENLMTEAVLGGIAKIALKPLYDFMDKTNPEDFYDDNWWNEFIKKSEEAEKNMNVGLPVAADNLERIGVLSRNLGDEMTGISKDIATASEESILGLSSLINTSLFYVSNIDRNVAQITALLGGGMDLSSNEQLIDIFTIQNQHLAYLPSIALYTSQTAERCERAASACENIAENLNRVIKPNGVQGSYKVNASL